MQNVEISKNELLWRPNKDRVKETSLNNFITHVNISYKTKINDFNTLHKWSIENRSNFWNEIWRRNNLDKNANYDKNSIYEKLKDKHKIN